MTIKITRLQIRNYRGIKALDAEVPPAGTIARGRNGSGKTTLLNAIGAALAASDLGPDAVRIGEEEAEILIDLEAAGRALHVRRRYTPSGSTLAVTTDEGDRKVKPATVLQALLGSSPLDVVGLVLERDKAKRRELVLSALPMRVTVDRLRQWVPGLPEDFDASGHALVVLERLRAAAYARRTVANKSAKDAAGRLAAARDGVQEPPVDAPGITVEEAARESDLAAREHARIEARAEQAARASQRAEGTREQITGLRAEAARQRVAVSQGPTEAAWSEVTAAHQDAKRAVDQARAALAAAEAEEHAARGRLQSIETLMGHSDRAREEADRLESDAQLLEQTLAATIEAVDPEELRRAWQRVEDAKRAEDRAKDWATAEASRLRIAALTAESEEAAAEAARLDQVVRTLTTEAPAALLAEAEGVPAGLELDGDEVRLHGVSLDRLCGAEQMRFAADVARGLHRDVGFVIVDGLERLDPEQLEAFVGHVTAGGHQLIGSIVDRGELVLAAVEPVRAEAAE